MPIEQEDSPQPDQVEPEAGSKDVEVELNPEVEKWKALARKNEQRAKENAEKAKRLDEIEEASKTEAEKAAAELEKIREENRQLLRSSVAATKGVPADLLTGTTAEELEASADLLLEFLAASSKPKPEPSGAAGNVGEHIGDGSKSAAAIVSEALGK